MKPSFTFSIDLLQPVRQVAFGVLTAACAATGAAADLYIATDGSDGNPGTEARPFATLERARDAVRDWE